MLRSLQTSGPTRTALALVTATVCVVGTAHAQSTYVGASAFADIARFGTGGLGVSSGGEALGGAIRIGTAITERWGIDLEFARPGEIEQEDSIVYALGIPSLTPFTDPVFLSPGTLIDERILPPPFRFTTTERYSTLTVMPWVRQSLGARADIVYLGGLALVRTTTRQDFGNRFRLLGIRLGEPSVTYGAAPAVGLDVRVSMTDHLRLVPGMRIVAVDSGGRSGWLTRPSVGLQWSF